ncbi:MAG: histidine kinase, partial [Gammaproteobacteria bacterium]|nr:histidine kinase [Gammaproteobacteria bacterium]
MSIDNPNLHKTQLNQLEETATQALGNMRHIVNELRPALLDDMGLSAAMRHHVNNFSNLTGIQTTLEISQADHRLPGNLETILFRIT